jgi:flagellar basal-body rod modification protein FlgD
VNINGTDALNYISSLMNNQQNKTDTKQQSSTSKTGLEQQSTDTTKKPKKEVDTNTFMTLLVAQLKNQDPLQPQDGTQFVAQLAQFNSLEQLININKKLGEMVENK